MFFFVLFIFYVVDFSPLIQVCVVSVIGPLTELSKHMNKVELLLLLLLLLRLLLTAHYLTTYGALNGGTWGTSQFDRLNPVASAGPTHLAGRLHGLHS